MALSVLRTRVGSALARGAALTRPTVGVRCMSSETATFEAATPFESHLIDGPSNTFEASKDEMMEYLRMMMLMRRMEIACDNEYKSRAIRGFCHLYDGQEAIAMGLESGLTRKDSITTSYRCHAIALARGHTVEQILAEMFGFIQGASKGKGGSMHFYNKASNYWGGAGIVGAQVPVGAGVGFANKYLSKGEWPAPISISMFGDGAANQGQIWEAANMSKLWNLPNVFMCENNQYGMGTSSKRSSCNPEYYKQGGVVIPGIRCDGFDVLAVRECMRFAREYCGGGNGPLFVEMRTYRYHGHSMSDPGISYRDRDEVTGMRESKDCIETLKKRIIGAGWADAAELKKIEKEVRAEVTKAVAAAKKGNLPPEEEVYTDIYVEGVPKFVRGNEYATSIGL